MFREFMQSNAIRAEESPKVIQINPAQTSAEDQRNDSERQARQNGLQRFFTIHHVEHEFTHHRAMRWSRGRSTTPTRPSSPRRAAL